MTYLATIKYPTCSRSMFFQRITEAERWLDSNNNNLEYATYIEEFNDDWQKTDGFMYTQEKK